MATTTTATSFFLILLLILLLSVFSTITTAQRNSNITIGSTLSPTTNTISWLSNSGRFAFGFYPQQDGGFVVGIWFDRIQQRTVVWTHNQDSPKVTNDVTLLLTTRGLILQSAQGRNQSISETSEPVSYASMLDTGNMVLYNSNSKILWQSFDSPTNTILQGQPLKTGKALVSRVSETDYSKGKFELSMQIDGQLVQYPTEKPKLDGYSYWASETYLSGTNVTLNLNDDGRLYLLNTIDGVNVKNLSGSDTRRRNTPTNETIFYRLTIDVDGILRLYSHTLNRNGNWSIKWNSTDDTCAPKGSCGLNEYCTLMDKEAECLCLPGFSFIDPNQKTLGCGRETDVDACRSKDGQTKYTMHTLEDTAWEDLPYSVLTSTTEESCRDACLEDCNCEAVMFLNQDCKKQKFPLRYGRRNIGSSTTATSFIKVANTKNTNAIKVIEKSKKELQLAILIASVSLVTCAFIVLGISGFLIYRHRTLARYKILEQGNNELNEAFSLRSFTYGELEKATDNFKEVLGRGSFGTVFKGALSDGTSLIAVKRLEKVVDGQGEREFLAEMRTIGRTHHKSLVQLLGYCHEGTNRLLVYEYMSNGSLADFLFKSEESPGWNERVQIALNISRGILYLHEECATQIIHCDIKPQNILMDEFRFAKIADFGLAKLLKQDQTKTYTGIRGTRGYVAPEWHKNLPVTVKADVYSFGIVLLEIICLRRSLNVELHEDEVVLVDWVFHCFDTGNIGKLVSDEEVDMRRFERMIKVALWCIQDEPSMRPTMKKVVLMLEGTIDIPNPPSPTSFLSSI